MPKPRMTGPDYLMGIAQDLGERHDVPFTRDFQALLWGAFPPEGEVPGIATALAQKPLLETERTAATIVAAAAQMAARNKDWESLSEVLRIGLQLAFRLTEYVELANIDLDDAEDGDDPL